MSTLDLATPHALSAAAMFGVLSLVFQQTWAEGLLGFESTGTIVAWIPLFAFLSMIEMKEMGIGLATAVFLDAMVIPGARAAVADGAARPGQLVAVEGRGPGAASNYPTQPIDRTGVTTTGEVTSPTEGHHAA